MTILRLYTEFSLLTGECRLSEITSAASALGYTSVAKTDINTCGGNVEFFEYAKKNGIKPIAGCEIKSLIGGKEATLLMLAKNEEGLYALNVYSSFAMTEKSTFVPETILPKYSQNIFAILVGYEPHSGHALLEKLKLYFPHLYAGLERLPDEPKEKTEKLYDFFAENGIDCVIATPVYLTKKENGEVLSFFNFIKKGTISPKEEYNCYLRSSEEYGMLFSHLPHAIANTERIGKECNAAFSTSKLHLPSYPVEAGENAHELLKKKAFSGLSELGREKDEKYVSRLEKELSIIKKMGFSDYFLITADFVCHAKKEGIPVGPGRGSGVGSLVAFSLGITAVDPLEKGLIFERFLNEERITMPDFDIDIGDEERERVISYVVEKYGKKHVCKIANYSPFAFRQVIRDVEKYFGYDLSAAISAIPDKTGITVDVALSESEELKKEYSRSEKVRNALHLCKLLEGRPRVISPHPSGIILTPSPVLSHSPLMSYGDFTLTQYSMDACAKLGLLKIDFLGIKYLTVISKAKKYIKKRYGSVYDNLPPQSQEVYNMLSKGDSVAVFQLESEGMKELLKKLSPRSTDELCHLISLYRPGPKVFIDSYIKGKLSNEKNPCPIEQFRDIECIGNILKETYGCPVYQEQIMEICTKAASFTLGHADMVRRAMAKKDHAKMEKEKKAFVDGCERNGISKEKAASVFDVISGFASYAFNKSHGAAYALLAYETAYLKCMYPKEYFAAKLDSEGGHFKKTNDYSLELQKLGTKLLPPCINRSAEDFLPCDNGVRYSLSAVKGVGRTIALKIVKEREKNGSFESPDDFISRLGGVVGTNAAVALARVGAFDIFGENRHTLSTLFENTVSGGAFSFHNEDQISLSFDSPEAVKYPRKHMAEYNETQLRIFEKEYTGVDFHFEMGIERKYALYIKLTHENEKALPLALKKLSDDKGASVVRIYDSRTEKTSQLKELFFIPTTLGLEELEQIMGKDNVKLKAL